MTAPVRSTDESLEGVIETFSGGTFRPLNPRIEDVRITDIAHALSQSCRFTGHTSCFYSVAEHSVLAMRLAAKWIDAGEYPEYTDPVLRLRILRTVLMHDASEAYLSDISRPIKMQPEFGDVYKRFEKRLEACIADRYDLIYPYPDIVRRADNAMLRSEQRDLMPGGFMHEGDDFLEGTIRPWGSPYAELQFHEAFAVVHPS